MTNRGVGRGFQRGLAGVLLVAVALFGVGLGASGVQTADAAISSLVILNPGCDRTSVQITWNGVAGYTPNMIRVQAYQTLVGPVAGLLGFADSVLFVAPFGTVAVDVPYAYSVPANTSITLLATQIEPATLAVAGQVQVSYLCTTGGGQPIPTATPVGAFALRLIVCDTPVYDAPGGRPVGDNRVRAGQTWYVNPVPVRDAAGGLWTAINVSGSNLAYIPARCVSVTSGRCADSHAHLPPTHFPHADSGRLRDRSTWCSAAIRCFASPGASG